jgi:hypothetical protein
MRSMPKNLMNYPWSFVPVITVSYYQHKMNVNVVRIFNILWTNILVMIVYALLYIKTLKQFVWIVQYWKRHTYVFWDTSDLQGEHLKLLIQGKKNIILWLHKNNHCVIIILYLPLKCKHANLINIWYISLSQFMCKFPMVIHIICWLNN